MLKVDQLKYFSTGKVKFEDKEYQFRSLLPPQYACYDCDLCCRGNFILTEKEKEMFKSDSVVFFERCPFLKKGKCTVYDSRPLQCRNFPIQISFSSGIELWVSFSCPHAFEGKVLNEKEISEAIQNQRLIDASIGRDDLAEIEKTQRLYKNLEQKKEAIENFIDFEEAKKAVVDITNMFLGKGIKEVYKLINYSPTKEKEDEILRQMFSSPKFFFANGVVQVSYKDGKVFANDKELTINDVNIGETEEEVQKIIAFYFLAQFSREHWYKILSKTVDKLLQKGKKPDMLGIWVSFLANNLVLLELCLKIVASAHESSHITYQIARESCGLSDWILSMSTITEDQISDSIISAFG